MVGRLGYDQHKLRREPHARWYLLQGGGGLARDLNDSVDVPAAHKTESYTGTHGSRAIKDLRAQLHDMHAAAQPFLTDDSRESFWRQVWELEVIHAALRVRSNRKQFYGFRLTAIISAIVVPSLVGLNLSGIGSTAVQWLTFSLSLVAALSTAVLTLFRFGDRWQMYRTLSNELLNVGWTLVTSSHTDLNKPWSAFCAATNSAISRYNAEYATEVIMQSGKSQPDEGITAEQVAEAVHAALVPPPLVSFSGAVGVILTNARTADDADGRRIWRIPRDKVCLLTVVVQTGPDALETGPAALSTRSGLHAWEPLDVRGGRQAGAVEMDLVLDAPFLEVTKARGKLTCPTIGGEAAFEGELRATQTGPYDLRVVLLSAGRLIQAVPVEIVVVENW